MVPLKTLAVSLVFASKIRTSLTSDVIVITNQ
jgi:hypothetical protein